jgi:hypothetical protein
MDIALTIGNENPSFDNNRRLSQTDRAWAIHI